MTCLGGVAVQLAALAPLDGPAKRRVPPCFRHPLLGVWTFLTPHPWWVPTLASEGPNETQDLSASVGFVAPGRGVEEDVPYFRELVTDAPLDLVGGDLELLGAEAAR